MDATSSKAPRAAVAFAILVLAACGGSGSSGSRMPPTYYTIGGSVTGLSGSGLVLRDNGGDNVKVTANGMFTFATRLTSGTAYAASVATQPTSPIQTCRISNGSGTVSTGSITSISVTCKTPVLTIVAGSFTGPGSVDGTGAEARFNDATGIATDTAGNIYVVDYAENNTIRKITPHGVVTTLAGLAWYSGDADGIGAAARFNYPLGIAADAAGNLYVGDDSHAAMPSVRRVSPAGAVTTLTLTDGYGSARAVFLGGFATDLAGNLYIAGTELDVIEKVTPDGVVSTLAGVAGGAGSVDGNHFMAEFSSPTGVATDYAGNVYVADSGNGTIRKVTPAGDVSTNAGTAGAFGSVDGTGAAAQFSRLSGITSDAMANLYVTDNNTVRKITPAAVVTTLAGTAGVQGNVDGVGAAAKFNGSTAIAISPAGNIFVGDTGNNSIRQITPVGVVTTVAGTADVSMPGSADGIGIAAGFNEPYGIAKDNAGNVYVADMFNFTIRKITPDGSVTTLAGTPGVQGTADGIGAAAQFCQPVGIATDSAGNLYVTDGGTVTSVLCNDNTIRKITQAGIVSTVAGMAGTSGSADGTGAAARFDGPHGIATDSAGNLYVTDSGNYLIRKITPAGVVTTLAGDPGISGSADGVGAAARFLGPTGIATDNAGNLYVCDGSIRKITPAGVVTTFAGAGGIGSADGAGNAARFNGPQAVSTDSAGNVYVADTFNATIRKITPDGMVSTVVGVPNQAGFATGVLPGLIGDPLGIVIVGSSLYITLYNGVAVVQDVP